MNAGYGSLACIKRLAFTVSYNSSQPSCVFKLPVWRNILVMEHPNSQHQGYSFFFLHLADKGDRKRWGAVGFFRKSLNRTPENCVHVMPRAVNNDFSWSGWCGIFASAANQIRDIRDIPPRLNTCNWSSCHSWPTETNLYNIEIYLFLRITHSHFFATKWMSSVEDDLLDDHCAVNCSLAKGNLKPLCSLAAKDGSIRNFVDGL